MRKKEKLLKSSMTKNLSRPCCPEQLRVSLFNLYKSSNDKQLSPPIQRLTRHQLITQCLLICCVHSNETGRIWALIVSFH
uniref:Uncharacterized protein n=1 Tax=Octopus bimaculoides TaxID=37653 RepID=A0A0L8IEJ0_OCTBM